MGDLIDTSYLGPWYTANNT